MENVRYLVIFGLLIILLMAAQFASAKTVDEVIEKYMDALGGAYRLAAVKSLYMEGIGQSTTQQTIKLTKVQDTLSRTAIEQEGSLVRIIEITDTICRRMFPQNITEEIIPDENLWILKSEMDIAGPLINYAAKGHKAEMIGKEKLDGNTCFKIRLITKDGNKILFWINAATFLLTQSDFVTTDGERSESTLEFKDYKPVDGIMFAHTILTKRRQENSELSEVEQVYWYSISVNPF